MSAPLLTVRGLRIDYDARTAVEDVSLSVSRGEVLAIVGESGSGKSTIARALLGVLPAAGRVVHGEIRFEGTDLRTLDPGGWRMLRGRRIAYVPQDPGTGLNPTRRVGDQVAESLIAHQRMSRRLARRAAVADLDTAGLRDPARVASSWPHELSGGMRQRALIAAAFTGGPSLIVADEPTSALDTTVQRRILDHLTAMVSERDAAMILITHDLAVAAERADRIVVMREGRIVEAGDTASVLGTPADPYVRELVEAMPSLVSASARTRAGRAAAADDTLLRVRDVVKVYPDGTKALDGVGFDVHRGRTLALVGESGSGKSTLARIVIGLVPPTSGEVRFEDTDVVAARPGQRRALRSRLQIVQQNPYSSFDPLQTIGDAIIEPLAIFRSGHRASRKTRMRELLDHVALPSDAARKRPHELSGGQLQRAAIARALALSPRLIVCDEPVSALDVSVQSQVLGLLTRLQAELGLSYLFITHDLGVVAEIADDLAVLDRGVIVESGRVGEVFSRPRHATTRELLAAVPSAVSRKDDHDQP